MEKWIAGAMAVLGTLLVLSGGGIIVLKAMAVAEPAGPAPVTADGTTETVAKPGVPARVIGAARRMPAADRLIGWGIVLLILGAVAAGAISFTLGASAGTR